MFGRAGSAVAALLVVAGCAGATPSSDPTDPTQTDTAGTDTAQTGTAQPTSADTFLPPPSSEVFKRALRTDMCALLDETAVAELGWRRGTSQAETLTSCAAASPDQKRSVTLSVDTAVSDGRAPADGNRCSRLQIVDPTTMIALKVQLRAEPDPCAPADRFLATAVRRFESGIGEVKPPNPWIALDACELLPPLLPTSARTLGGPKPTLREVRRLGARACIATHTDGEVTLSVSPAPGKAEDLDGDEIAVAFRAARVQELTGVCVLRLVGQQMGQRFGHQVQVITIEVDAADDRCAVAAELAEALSPTLPDS